MRTVTYIILRSGPAELGRWLKERRDVRADYSPIFGEEPPDPGAITLSIDSASCGSCRSRGNYKVDRLRAVPG